MSDALFFVILIAVSIWLIIIFRFISIKKLIGKRDHQSLDVIYEGIKNEVSFETFSEVFQSLGDSYSIDPRLLRIEDTLIQLQSLDSWSLGSGTEKMEKWLTDRGITKCDVKLTSVKDILLLVESNMKRSN